MTERALLIVDVQNDFCEGGALAVTGGAAVAEKISAYLAEHLDEYALVVASRDWHDAGNDNGGHFATEPDFMFSWPVHCVANTEGAEYHPALDLRVVDQHIRKGQGKPSYSAFEGTSVDGHQTLEQVLSVNGITDLDVVGIATDYCVFASARDAVKSDLRVRVLTDLVAGVAPESSANALRALAAAGVDLTVVS